MRHHASPVFSVLLWKEAAVAGPFLVSLVVGGRGVVVVGLGGLGLHSPQVDLPTVLWVVVILTAAIGGAVQLLIPARMHSTRLTSPLK